MSVGSWRDMRAGILGLNFAPSDCWISNYAGIAYTNLLIAHRCA